MSKRKRTSQTPWPEDESALVFVCFDFETTGPDPLRDEVVQIGAQCLGETFQSLVRPSRGISASATAVHGFTDETVRDARGFPLVWEAFLSWLRPLAEGARHLIFVGHNSWVFDDPMLASALERDRLPDPDATFSLRVWSADTLRAARVVSPGECLRLEVVHRRLVGREMGKAHDALADATAVAEIAPFLADAFEYRPFAEAHEKLEQRRVKRDSNAGPKGDVVKRHKVEVDQKHQVEVSDGKVDPSECIVEVSESKLETAESDNGKTSESDEVEISVKVKMERPKGSTTCVACGRTHGSYWSHACVDAKAAKVAVT